MNPGLGKITWRSCGLESLLDLIVGELDKSVVLLRQFHVQYLIVLLSDLGLLLFEHSLADKTNLSECEQRLLFATRTVAVGV